LRIFIAAFCFGYLFGKLISSNKLLFPNVYFQFITFSQLAVLSAILHVKTSYTTDGATICNDYPDALGIFQNLLLSVLYLHLHLYASWRCWLYRKIVSTKPGFFVSGLLIFSFFKNKAPGLVKWKI